MIGRIHAYHISVVQPKFGGKIIDIVSGDIHTPEQKSAALEAVKSTIITIFLIVIIGYEHFTYIKGIQLGLLFDSTSHFWKQYSDFFSSACTALRAWLFSSASERVVARLRKNLFSHLVHQVKNIFICNFTGLQWWQVLYTLF